MLYVDWLGERHRIVSRGRAGDKRPYPLHAYAVQRSILQNTTTLIAALSSLPQLRIVVLRCWPCPPRDRLCRFGGRPELIPAHSMLEVRGGGYEEQTTCRRRRLAVVSGGGGTDKQRRENASQSSAVPSLSLASFPRSVREAQGKPGVDTSPSIYLHAPLQPVCQNSFPSTVVVSCGSTANRAVERRRRRRRRRTASIGAAMIGDANARFCLLAGGGRRL